MVYEKASTADIMQRRRGTGVRWRGRMSDEREEGRKLEKRRREKRERWRW